MRRMLQAPRYATIAGMRGEIGISSMKLMKSRIARSRIQYVRRKMQGEESLVRGTMEEMRARGDEWWKRTVRYMDWAGVKVEELSVITQQEVKSRIARRVGEEWEAEMQEKTTLWKCGCRYRECKTEMREEDYGGGEKSRLWFRARTNCLELRGRRRGDENRSCPICAHEVEDLAHFVLECAAWEKERAQSLALQRPRLEDGVETLKLFLFGGREGWREGAEVLCDMWRARRRRINGMELGG